MAIAGVTNYEIEEAREVLSAHVTKKLGRESALEAGIFAIASAGTYWDGFPTKLISELRQISESNPASYAVLSNKKLIDVLSKDLRWRFHHSNRFHSLIDKFNYKSGNWWEEVVNADETIRNKYTKKESEENINWMGLKTFSFWHLCLGGKNLATLDIHVRTQLKERFGFYIDEKYVTYKKRRAVEKSSVSFQYDLFGEEINTPIRVTQRVSSEPPSKVYLEIEKQMREFFGIDERFIIKEGKDVGKVDLALATTLLWWARAKREPSEQRCLPGFEKGHSALPNA